MLRVLKGFGKVKFWNKIITAFKNAIINAMSSGCSPHKLALSFCTGIYIAFSPFPGAHTIMMFIFKWMLGLNFPVLFIATSINNPWTMIPFFSLDYVFGYWFVHVCIGWEPSWVISLVKIFGYGKICLWSFLIGGNLLGIACGLLCYPIVYYIFKKFIKCVKLDAP